MYKLKLDADDQQQELECQKAEIEAAIKKAQTPRWEKSPSEIASWIAEGFFLVDSLQHADLRRQIIATIEAEREVAKYYMTQMGRWWERFA